MAQTVISKSSAHTLEPFKTKMNVFCESAMKTIDKMLKELQDSQDIFIDAMRFYHFTPRTGTLENCTPSQFFEYWTNFTNDFKDIWKKEIVFLMNELYVFDMNMNYNTII